ITRMHQHVIRGNVEHSVQQMPCRSAVKGNKCSGIKSTIKQLAVHGILDNDIGYGFGKVPFDTAPCFSIVVTHEKPGPEVVFAITIQGNENRTLPVWRRE